MKHRKPSRSALSRREFIAAGTKVVAASTLSVGGFPHIVHASVLGPRSPSNQINVGFIGTGRIARDHDMPGILKHDRARVVAVCDVDSKRAEDAKILANNFYSQRRATPYDGVRVHSDYRALLKDKDIDAVVICTPDHWHAIIGIHAVEAGKDVYVEKPASLTIEEGRSLSDAVHRTGRVLQIGSQQRSSAQFRYAAELVRNGRIGDLKIVYVGLPGDPAGEPAPEMPVPKNLNYDMWLGSTPFVYYTENRVHPQDSYRRPGWLRCEQFGAGMITGWGSHHIDIAHWGMNAEYTGPIEVKAEAEFPTKGLWNVHGKFRSEALYASGVRMIVSSELKNGIKFEGTEGWIFVARGRDSVAHKDPRERIKDEKALSASDPKIITSVIGPNEIHLEESYDHHGNWLDAIRSRKSPIAPVEVGHRSCSTCLVHHISMKLKRKVYWNPDKERFRGDDDEANALLSRRQRRPYVAGRSADFHIR